MDHELMTFARGYFTSDQSILANPYPAYRALRERGPIHRINAGTGEPWDDAWHVFDYATVSALLRDERLSARRDMGGRRPARPGARGTEQPVAPAGAPVPPMMLTMDPPDHTRLRRLVSTAFTPRVIAQLRGEIITLVDGLLDSAAARGDAFDLVHDVAYPLPTIVIARLLGLPEEDWPAIKRWSKPGIAFAQDERSFANAMHLGAYLAEAVARRRREPASDLIGALVAARDDGDVLSDAELVGQCQLLLVAGHETTSFALASAVLALVQTPDAWHTLPEQNIALAVDEVLRFEAPFQVFNRRVASPLRVGDHDIPADALIWLWIGAANRDPARFPDPDYLDLARQDNRHLSFGLGLHFCLGAALARLELAVALSRLRARYPRLRLEQEPIIWRDAAIRGPERLMVSG